MSDFYVAPNEAFQDHRLSLIQLRVLCALYSFRNGRSTNLVFPSREKLAARCGYSVATVSRATAGLVGLGWLKKTGKGGRSMAVKYEILDAQQAGGTVTDPVRVSKPVNGDRSGQGFGAKTVTDPGTKTVTGSVTRKEETKEETKTKEKINKKKNGFSAPTFEQVGAYIAQHDLQVCPERFFDHYTANGWKVGRVGMKDWQATLRNWSRKNAEGNQHRKTSTAQMHHDTLKRIAARGDARALGEPFV